MTDPLPNINSASTIDWARILWRRKIEKILGGVIYRQVLLAARGNRSLVNQFSGSNYQRLILYEGRIFILWTDIEGLNECYVWIL